MKRSSAIFLIVLVLALVQMACYLPSAPVTGGNSTTQTPGAGTETATLPPVITATSQPDENQPDENPTATQAVPTRRAPTPTKSSGHVDGPCTYKAAFLGDVTIPDDTLISAGKTFVKTWRVRNDGTCTWGPNGYALHALAFTSGSQMGAPGVIPLHANVKPGQTIDVSVTLDAPTTAGTYTSNWMFRIDNDPSGRGPYLGVGGGDEPLYARIKVGSPNTQTRLKFPAGATAIKVDGSIKAKQTKGYVLAAQKGQVILAQLSPAAGDSGAFIKITASDNTPLQGTSSNNSTNIIMPLPSTQDYILWVNGGSADTDFSLAITIPSRITFDPGAVSASVDGKVSNHMQVSYILRALAGQTMTVELTGNDIGLTIYGLKDGTPLVRAEGGATSWTGELPATQDYIIIVVPAVDSTTFTVDVTVE